MPLPLSFLFGLFALIGADEFDASLPHDARFATALPYLGLILLPWFLIQLLGRRSLGAMRRRRAILHWHVRRWGMTASIPLCYAVLLIAGEWSRIVDQGLPTSITLATLIKVLPLIGMEIGADAARIRVERRTGETFGQGPFHLLLVGLFTMVVLVLSGLADLLAMHRGLSVFFLYTALGNQLAMLLALVALSVAMPLLFRCLTSPGTEIPADARNTARALGFPRSRVRLLRSENRMINAMLVGPLRITQYLFLTDGLIRVLDPLSLRGVVAHEVGHAKANHPLLLLVTCALVPLLLIYPLDLFGIARLGDGVLVGLLVVILVFGIRWMRRMFHRFELEADLLSAEALGGALPCILALHKVSEIAGGEPERATLRHPSEEGRILHLLSCEGDPWFRDAFRAGSLRLRRVLLGVFLVALGLSAWAHARLWPIDEVILQQFTGQFAAASESLAALPAELPVGREGLVAQLREENEAALSLMPAGGPWHDIREELAAKASRRGGIELIRNGPKVARRWYSVAMAKRSPTPLDISLLLYCEAAAQEDRGRQDELREHLLTHFALDDDLAQALRTN